MTAGELWRRAIYLVRRSRMTAELEEEMRLHVELRARQYGEHGLHAAEAEARARRQFGNRAALVERSGDEWGLRWAEALVQDTRYAFRTLRRTPWLTAVIVLTLALVIGANTAIFGLLHAVLLRRLPVSHPEQLVALHPMHRGSPVLIDYTSYEALRQSPGVPRTEAYRFDAATVTVRDGREELWVDRVSGGFFGMLGVRPLLGRTITASDEVAGAPVVVISEEFRARHFGPDAPVIGTSIGIEGVPFTIVGVMPRSYSGVHFARRFDLAVPLTALSLTPGVADVRRTRVNLVARLEGGSGAVRYGAALDLAFQHCCLDGPPVDPYAKAVSGRRVLPEDAPTAVTRIPLDSLDPRPHVVMRDASRGLTWSVDYRGEYRRVLVVLMAGVAVLLVIACANVGTLLLARAAARQRELAMRMSLGASRGRLVRQLLTESLGLALVGAGLGLVVARVGTAVLLHILPPAAARLSDVAAWRPTPAVLAFTAATIIACTLLFGLWPARLATRTDILTPLRGTKRGVGGVRAWSVDRALVVAQVALALVLVCAATLFVATLRNLSRYEGGYRSTRVLLARIEAEGTRYAADSAVRLPDDLLDGLRRLPGVSGAAMALTAPVFRDEVRSVGYRVPGYEAPRAGEIPARFNAVTAGFFSATGVGLRSGREFDAGDVATGTPVAVVSEAFARRYFPGRDPLGATVIAGDDAHSVHVRIVGVARDAQYDALRGSPADALRAPPSEVWYMPLTQLAALRMKAPLSLTLAVRTAGDPMALAPLLRREVDVSAPGVRVRRLVGVQQLLDDALARERLAAALATLFGAVALVLAAIGAYGLLSHITARRTHEIGVRMALGARAEDAVWLVLRQALGMAAVGIAIGIPLALGVARLIRSQLHGVAAGDPRVMIGSAAVLLLVGILASLIPGRRAARVDPMVALRNE